jgi:lysophospholipase L1-like esterase
VLTIAIVGSVDEPRAAADIAHRRAALSGVGYPLSTTYGSVAERAASCQVNPEGTPGDHPLVVAIGASFTAGVGPDKPSLSWAVRLGELLNWRAATLGIPGAGYTNAGLFHLGPLAKEVDLVHLALLHPKLVIIQAGHNDWRVPPAAEARNVANLIRQIQRAAPHARLVFLTAFSSRAHPASAARVRGANSTIVRTIRASDRTAIIIDPLAWRFPRAADGLHPTAAGDLMIAEHVAHILVETGAVPKISPRPAAAQVRCKTLGSQWPIDQGRLSLGAT